MIANKFRLISLCALISIAVCTAAGQEASKETPKDPQTDKAEAVIAKAVQAVGGERYLQVRSLVGRGKYSVLKDGAVVSFQSFVDVMVYPDRERAEFKGGGTQLTQVNAGDTGWVYDGDQDVIKVQTETQVANFKQGLRTSLDNLLRGHWKGSATLAYLGKRPATLGKRNEAIRLTYSDGFGVEFEFAADDGLPAKAIYKRLGADGEEVKEEDRYAQFVETGGIRSPYIIDHWTGGKPSSRINYESIEFNKPIPDSIFTKPANVKDARKDLKL